jgi:hypothetical protein
LNGLGTNKLLRHNQTQTKTTRTEGSDNAKTNLGVGQLKERRAGLLPAASGFGTSFIVKVMIKPSPKSE